MDKYALDDAAAAVLYGLQNKPAEHIGVLYDGGNGIQSSNTVSTGNTESTKGKIQFKGKPRALFHNHPPATGGAVRSNREITRGGSGIEEFSNDDKTQARKLGLPSYIVTPDGRLRMFNPLNNETTDVLAMFPTEQFQQMIIQKSIK